MRTPATYTIMYKRLSLWVLLGLLFAQTANSQETPIAKEIKETKDFSNPALQAIPLKVSTSDDDFNQAALHPDSDPVTFVQSGTYPWIAGDKYVYSGNSYQDGTSSWFSATIENEYEIELSFEWYSTSEGSFDFFNFWINNNLEVHHSGGDLSDFSTFSVYLPAGSYTLTWEYSKDGSSSSYLDAAQVRNIKVHYFREPSSHLLFDIVNGVLIDYFGYGGNVVIPDEVVAIARYAFYEKTNIISVAIPSSVTNIGSYAFGYCSGLREITVRWPVPLSVSPTVFEGVDKRQCALIVPESSFDAYLEAEVWKDFFNDSDFVVDENGVLTGYYGYGGNIVIPNTVKSIADWVFRYNYNLTSVVIPKSVVNIGYQAFAFCENLRSLEVREENPAYSSLNGVLYDKDRTALICYPVGKTGTSFTIPGSVEDIEDFAFSQARLSDVILPDNLVNIGNYAFAYCQNLSSISIPGTVTGIGEFAFGNATSLREIRVYWETPIPLSGNVFSGVHDRNCILWVPQNTKAIYRETLVWNTFRIILEYGEEPDPYIDFEIDENGVLTGYYGLGGNVVIPDIVTAIGEYVFAYQYNIYSITIPSSVTRIGEGAFYVCERLSSILIPEGITRIADYTFAYCYNLSSVSIPHSVTAIDRSAFYYCENLSSILIPEEVTSIADYAFAYCSNLQEITVQWTTPLAIPASVFEGVSKRPCTLIVPEGSLETYQTAPVWRDFLDKSDFEIDANGVLTGYYGPGGDVVIPDRVTAINSLVFTNNNNLTSITIPGSVTTIYSSAFYYCSNLTSVNLSEGLLSIEYGAFAYCSSLQTISIPGSVTSIGGSAFENCSNLTSVNLPEGLLNIGYSAFANCYSLQALSIPGSVTRIDSYAFGNCYNLQEITVRWITPLELWSGIFWGVNKETCVLNVPSGTKEAYQAAYIWGEFLNIKESQVSIPTVEPGKISVIVVRSDNELKINSPAAENIRIYSIAGNLLYDNGKPAGEYTFNIERIQDKVLIVKGASGWVKKVIK